MKKKGIILCVAIMVFIASLVILKWDAVFQRGNPLPYLAAAIKLSDENTFATVRGVEDTYITRQGDKQELFQMVQETYQVEYIDQLGSSYLFSDGEKNYMVGSEIYWSRFTVWTLSFEKSLPGWTILHTVIKPHPVAAATGWGTCFDYALR